MEFGEITWIPTLSKIVKFDLPLKEKKKTNPTKLPEHTISYIIMIWVTLYRL